MAKKKIFRDLFCLTKINFPISKIKSFYYFDIGRWDILLKNNVIIKITCKNFDISLKNFLDLGKKIDFENIRFLTIELKINLF